MKLCPKCHTANASDAVFCMQCQHKLAEVAPLCPANLHPMDPSWLNCPYCRSAQGGAGVIHSVAKEEAQQQDAMRKRTVVEDDPAKSDETAVPTPKRQAVFGNAGAAQPASAAPCAPAPYWPGRRIVAVLVTYTWRPEGEVFPVYEGRNYIGHEAECEIRVTGDNQLSGKHATIFYRGAGFEICDEKSFNGTWLNDQPVPFKGQPLPPQAEFKTGATIWKFMAAVSDTQPSAEQ